jgi:hypothetical protein
MLEVQLSQLKNRFIQMPHIHETYRNTPLLSVWLEVYAYILGTWTD